MKTDKIIMRIDPERKREIEAISKYKTLSSAVTAAIDALLLRDRIEQHIRASIHENLRFATDEDFRAYCNATGKTPMNAGRIITEDDFVLNEMYMFLLQWHRRGFRESYLAEFFEREYWRPAESLTPDAFEEQRKLADMLDGYAEESLARPITRKPRRKAEATA